MNNRAEQNFILKLNKIKSKPEIQLIESRTQRASYEYLEKVFDSYDFELVFTYNFRAISRIYSNENRLEILSKLLEINKIIRKEFSDEICQAFENELNKKFKQYKLSFKDLDVLGKKNKKLSPISKKPSEVFSKNRSIALPKKIPAFSLGFLSSFTQPVTPFDSILSLSPKGKILMIQPCKLGSRLTILSGDQVQSTKEIKEKAFSAIFSDQLIALHTTNGTSFYNSEFKRLGNISQKIKNFIGLTDNKIIFHVDVSQTSKKVTSELVLHDLKTNKYITSYFIIDEYNKPDEYHYLTPVRDIKLINPNQFVAINGRKIEIFSVKNNAITSMKKITFDGTIRLNEDIFSNMSMGTDLTKINISPDGKTLVLLTNEGKLFCTVKLEDLISNSSKEPIPLVTNTAITIPCLKNFTMASNEEILAININNELFKFHFENLSKIILSKTILPSEIAKLIEIYLVGENHDLNSTSLKLL